MPAPAIASSTCDTATPIVTNNPMTEIVSKRPTPMIAPAETVLNSITTWKSPAMRNAVRVSAARAGGESMSWSKKRLITPTAARPRVPATATSQNAVPTTRPTPLWSSTASRLDTRVINAVPSPLSRRPT